MLVPLALAAQSGTPELPRGDDDPALAALLARTMTANPRLRATAARTAAAQSRVAVAAARPDLMLMTGLQSFPLFTPGFGDGMTMKMLGISQTVLYPGKQRLRRTVAERDANAVAAQDRTARAELVAAVKAAWYELAYLDAALALTRQQREALNGIAAVALARYDAGGGSQADVLTARIDAARVIDDETGLRTDRSTTVAALNSLLDRASDTPVDAVTMPARIRRAAIPDSSGTRAPALDSLEELLTRAMQGGPMLVSHQREIDAQSERLSLARLENRPDFDLTLQYGQRNQLPDMVTVQLAIPLRLERRTRQGDVIAAARADVAALEAEHHVQRNEVRTGIARLLATAERARSRIALYTTAVLPQRRAAIEAAFASYRANGGSLAQVLSAQAAMLSDNMMRARALSDFAQSVAALELIVGSEVLP
jgi:outer membrane protein, heavy metal efflux system